MEETISTTSEVSTEQTTPDVVETETTQPVETEQTTEETTTQEPAEATTTETEIEQPKNWEQIAKDNQASFTRVSQELAELKKQIANNQPKYVDDRGKITPEYERQYRFSLDNQEFLTYDNAVRRLGPEDREIAEQLLEQAKTLYNPNNKTAYEQKMNEIKNYFDADFNINVALEKKNLESQMQSEFNRLQQEFKTKKSQEIAELVEQSEDLKTLLYRESENYSPEVFGIVRQMFDLTGGVDLDVVNKAVSSIKSLGVKEYLAQQKAQAEKQKATVPTGQAVTVNNQTLTKDYAMSNYREAVKKFGMDKVDEVLMKG
ncbi:MAG: hypothetical protein ACI4S3_06055 [Candidatus Gastranaerophilaceae bacterium]